MLTISLQPTALAPAFAQASASSGLQQAPARRARGVAPCFAKADMRADHCPDPRSPLPTLLDLFLLLMVEDEIRDKMDSDAEEKKRDFAVAKLISGDGAAPSPLEANMCMCSCVKHAF